MFSQKKAPALSPRAKYEQQYKTCRYNLLAAIIFTLVSMVTYYINGVYFLFSVFLPLLIFATGVELAFVVDNPLEALASGWYTLEDIEGAQLLDAGTWLAITIVMAVIILAVYLICWIASKKHPAAMIVAAAFFAIDCVVLLLCFDETMIMDLVFHAWVMFYLVLAIIANAKLKKLPPEEAAPLEGSYTVINGEPVPSASATPSEFIESAPTAPTDETNTPNE